MNTHTEPQTTDEKKQKAALEIIRARRKELGKTINQCGREIGLGANRYYVFERPDFWWTFPDEDRLNAMCKAVGMTRHELDRWVNAKLLAEANDDI